MLEFEGIYSFLRLLASTKLSPSPLDWVLRGAAFIQAPLGGTSVEPWVLGGVLFRIAFLLSPSFLGRRTFPSPIPVPWDLKRGLPFGSVRRIMRSGER